MVVILQIVELGYSSYSVASRNVSEESIIIIIIIIMIILVLTNKMRVSCNDTRFMFNLNYE